MNYKMTEEERLESIAHEMANDYNDNDHSWEEVKVRCLAELREASRRAFIGGFRLRSRVSVAADLLGRPVSVQDLPTVLAVPDNEAMGKLFNEIAARFFSPKDTPDEPRSL